MTHDDDRDPLDLLAEEFTTALRNGEPPDVESWAASHPDQADAIRELFPTIVAMEEIKEATHASRPTVVLPGTVERLGDFRILGEIGRGGMGVVYEAEQESLGRRVALKVLPPLRDPRRQRRFERETRMAARLHHTNIVPIYGVGEAEGFSYYVMPVIRGVGLDVVIDAMHGELEGEASETFSRAAALSGMTPADAVRALRTGWFQPADRRSTSTDGSATSVDVPLESWVAPTSAPADPGPPLDPRARYWRSVADIGRQVADALAHAHHLGVLHRDVKPANLLLDAQGVVWVTDFGLAKAVGPDAGLTHSGDLVGTLQYMAPEQLHGAYDARSDIHALGLTLYELLTLTPAYSAGDRGTLLKRVAESSPARPSMLRQGIPRDLETIVIKAIQPDPAHRYQSADEFRTDLEAFLEDRPIRARRATMVEHGWRWCRRNKLVASLAGIALFAVVGAAITGWTAWATTRVASQRAERNLSLAKKTLEGVFDRIAGPDTLELVVDDTGTSTTSSGDEEDTTLVGSAPLTVSEADAALLEQMLGFYDQFAESNAEDAGLRLDTAKAYRRVGDIQMKLGRADAAIEAYERALSTLLLLDDGSGNHAITIAATRNDLGEARRASAIAATRKGEAQRASGGFEAAHSQHDQALELLSSLGDSASARFERARCHEDLGILMRMGRPVDRRPRGGAQAGTSDERREQGLAHLTEAQRIYDELAAEQPDNPTIELAAVRAGLTLGLSMSFARGPRRGGEANRDDEGQRVLRQSIQRLEALAAEHPGVTAYQAELANTYGWMLRFRRRGDPSDDLVDKALALAESLHQTAPDDERYRQLLATALSRRAERSLAEPIANTPVEQLVAARVDLARAVTLDRFDVGAHREWFQVLEALGDHERALFEREQWLTAMLHELDSDTERDPRRLQVVWREVRTLVRDLRADGKDDRAERIEQAATALEDATVERLTADTPGNDNRRRLFAAMLAGRAERSLPRDLESATPAQLQSARRDLELAIRLDDSSFAARRHLADVLERLGEHDLAETQRRRWITDLKKVVAGEEEPGRGMRRGLATELRALADALRARGDDAGATDADAKADQLGPR